MARVAPRVRAGSRRRPAPAGHGTDGGGKAAPPLTWPVGRLARRCAFTVTVGFAVVLARLTLQPSPASEALIHTVLHPGRSLRAYLDQRGLRDAVRQIGGNTLLGVPFGVLVPV